MGGRVGLRLLFDFRKCLSSTWLVNFPVFYVNFFKCSLEISSFWKYICWEFHTCIMYFDHIYPLLWPPSPSCSWWAPASPQQAPSLFRIYFVPSEFNEVEFWHEYGWVAVCWNMRNLSLATSMYVWKILNEGKLYTGMWRNHIELWFGLVLAQLVYCVYLPCEHLHSCWMVCKLVWGGGRPGLVMFTDIFSAFDISLSQVSGVWMDVLFSCVGVCLRVVCFSEM